MHKLFASQLDEEKIYLVVRRHWFFLAKRLFIVFLFLVAYAVLYIWGDTLAPNLFTGDAAGYVSVILKLLLLGVIFAFLMVWVLYYLNMQIITNIRLVDIEQVSLFARTVSELNIHNVQDVTSESHGIFATLFGFGDVYVQTAGAQQRFVFETIGHPEEIKKLLLDLYEAASHSHGNQPEHKTVSTEIKPNP